MSDANTFLRLTIDGKQKDFPFSLSGTASPLEILEVSPSSVVSAKLLGQFCIGDSPRYELTAGYDPDVRFVLRPKNDESGELHDPENNDLFRYVFGPSQLTLRYWEDFEDNDEESCPVLQIKIVGRHIDVRKRNLYESLCNYLTKSSNGHFLLDSFHGQNMETFNLLFSPGFSSNDDPLIHLDYLKHFLDDEFFHHLNGIIHHPFSKLNRTFSRCKATKARHLSNRSYELVKAHGTDGISVEELVWNQAYTCPCNDVIATFLYKLVHRLLAIKGYIKEQRKDIKTRYLGDRDRSRKGLKIHNEIQQAESDKEKLITLDAESDKLITMLQQFLSFPVFSYNSSRRKHIFDVSRSDFPKTIDYSFLYRTIREYEKTNFYWEGDESPFFQLPAYFFTEEGKDYWIRKYSMMYEYWCYLQIHATFLELGFKTEDYPDCRPMCLSVYKRSKGNMVVYLYHDVRSEKKYRPTNEFICPRPPLRGHKQTPDFALIFENRVSKKLALLIMDAKSNSRRKGHMRDCWLYLDSAIVGKRDQDLVFKQSWVVFSGEEYEDVNSPSHIEMPPSPKKHEYENLDEDIKEDACKLIWKEGSFRASFSANENETDPLRFIGYLRSHIRSKGDPSETDNFKEFLLGQVRLMEKVLSK